jgi:dienelactone hydrolase
MKTIMITFFFALGLCLTASYANAQKLTTDPESDGFSASWFPAEGASEKAIVVIGGSEGGNGFGNRMAPVLNQAGYHVLSVGLFRMSGLPQQLELVPLEYADRAYAWLMQLEDHDITEAALIGVSKGAEYALLHASLTDAWSAVVAVSPSSVAWQSINQQDFGSRRSSWSYKGEPADFLPYDFTGGFTGVFNLYNDALNGIEDTHTAIITSENISAPLFLASGGDDRLWPSGRMALMIAERFSNREDPPVLVHHHIPEAGHMLLVADPESAARSNKGTFAFLGGSRELVTEHVRGVQQAIMKFLAENF